MNIFPEYIAKFFNDTVNNAKVSKLLNVNNY